MARLRIGVLYKKRGNLALQERFAGMDSVQDTTEAEVAHHERALRTAGYPVRRIVWGSDLGHSLRASPVDLVFNVSSLVEAATLEELAMPYAGSNTYAIVLATHKGLAKRLWQHAGLPTSPFHVACSEKDCALFKSHPPFDYPLFLKPLMGRGSAGIDHTSVVENYSQLVREVERRHRTIGQPVLIEPYLRGREITVGVLGNGDDARTLPPLEIVLPTGCIAASFAIKQAMGYEALLCPAPLTDGETQMMQRLALKAYHVLGLADYGRIDTILTVEGPFLLEANTFAGLMYDPQDQPNSYMSFMAHAEGLRGQDLLDEIVRAAVDRLNVGCTERVREA
jgi:D-alanine-D-alanine ligase